MPINQYKGRIVSATQVTPQTYGASGEWSLNQQFQAAGSGTWPLQPLAISRSLRFNSADSAYLNRTPASTTNRRTWTFSGWVKRSALGSAQNILTATGVSRNTYITFPVSNALTIYSTTSAGGGDGGEYISTQLFRDVSAWYHIVVAYDSTQATSTNRIKAWVNGTQITAWSTATAPTLNHDTQFNWTSAPMQIGAYNTSQFQNGYFAEFNFVDGLQLDASSFGFFDLNGIWQAKTYTGTYGTNGFYLTFADNSNTTAATLGKDYSGNGNNWTPNNFSVAAGAGNDSLIDSPTNDLVNTDTGVGGEVRGNYCTLNPLVVAGTPTNGNLDYANTSGTHKTITGTIGVSSGKWYWEATNVGSGIVGIATAPSSTDYCGALSTSWGYRGSDGVKLNSGSSSAYGATYTTTDVIGIALDLDAGTLVFYKNNTSQGTAYTGLSGTFYPATGRDGQTSSTFNFGQRPFAYTAPSGYKALCSTNLPSPTILNGAQYFAASTYTGNGATQTITNGGNNNSLTTFAPDLVWIKSRSAATDNKLTDTVRGATKGLISNTTGAETTDTNGLTAFGVNGFTLGTDTVYNNNTATYIAWQWKAGGTAVTNTAGSITSSVSANTTAGFSVVTYTGTGANATVGHGLGVAPSMVIVKCRNSASPGGVTSQWFTYHVSVGATKFLQLNLTDAATTSSVVWNDTAPTSSVFSLGSYGAINNNTNTFVAYCFAPVSGFSAFGSYTGNGSTDGPFVYTGFRPRYVMVKNSGAVGNWTLLDTSRSSANPTDEYLWANVADAEVANLHAFDFLSNGFKIRNTTSDHNSNGVAYIYAAFAENPFKISRAR